MAQAKPLAFFERDAALWVFLCMAVGVALGWAGLAPNGSTERPGVRAGLAGGPAHRCGVADVLSHDAQSGFHRDGQDWPGAQETDSDAVVRWLIKPFGMAWPRALHAACVCGLD